MTSAGTFYFFFSHDCDIALWMAINNYCMDCHKNFVQIHVTQRINPTDFSSFAVENEIKDNYFMD